MANEFKVKNGLIVIGDLTTSGTITINGALVATQSWVTSQSYLTSASLSGYATQSYVTSAISALIDAAPAALDTLNELAAALGDDASFSTTVTNSIAGKVAKSGDTMTGSLTFASTADNVRLQKNSSFLNLRDPWNNIHLYNAGDGNYIDSNIHYWRSQSASYWMTLNNGNLGVGTVSPVSRLDVDGIISSRGIFIAQNNGTYNIIYNASNSVAMYLGGSGDQNSYYDNNSHFFRNAGGGTTFGRWNSTGLGIGTTSPATPLHVTGGASGSGGWNRTATLAATYPGLIFNSNGTKWGGMAYDYSAAMRFWVNANNDDIFAGTLAMSILNNGNVGIGTSSPSEKLHVSGRIMAEGSGYTLNPTAPIFGQYSFNRGYVQVPSNGQFEIWTGGTAEIATFYNNQNVAFFGNVGIGTTSPSSKLTVYSDTTADGILVDVLSRPRITLRDRGNSDTIIGTGDYGLDDFFIDTYSGNALAIKGSTRNVGIGTTTPTHKLTVAGGNVLMFPSDNTRQLSFFNDSYGITASSGLELITGDYIRFRQGSTELARVTTTGLGIGVSNPTATLSLGASAYDGNPLTALQYTQVTGGGRLDLKVQTWGTGSNYGLTTGLSVVTPGFDTAEVRVGIGTTSPSATLSIQTGVSDSSGNAFLFTGYNSKEYVSISKLGFIRTRASDLNGANMHFLSNDGANRVEVSASNAAFNWYSHALATTFLTFQHTTGNIGIGTTSPGAKLHVIGNTYIESGNLYVNTIAGYSTNLVSIAASTNVLVPSGDITIGSGASTSTTQPFGDFSQLKFDNLHSDTNRGPNKIVMHDNGGSWIGGFGIHSDTVSYYTGGHHRWYKTDSQTSSSQVMQLDPSGNLTVTGTFSASGYNKSNWDTAYSWGNHASAGYLTSETDTLASVTGRGASTSTAVTFNGGVNLAADTGIRKAGDNWIIGYSTSLPGIAIGSGTVTDKVSISSGGTQRVWFDTNGNVGIGTASPTEKLHVNGDTRIVGNTYVGGIINAYQGDASIWVPNLGQAFTVKQTTGNVGVGTSTPSEKLHVSGAAIFDGGSGNSSTDSVVYITKSNNSDWGLYVNASGLDYGMYARVSPSAEYALSIHNGTAWTTRITGNAIVYLGEKNAIEGNYDSWLRLNNSNHYTSGVYTPGVMRADGGFNVSGNTVWHAANDGSGSGLDADTVDGLQASSLLRSDIYNSNYGGLQVFRNIGTIDGSWPDSDHTFSLENSDAGNIVLNFHRGGYTSNNLRYNGSNFRFDAALESTGVITATGGNSSNWNTAYGWGNHASQGYATTSYVTTQINNLINGAPGALDTLDELAAALGDDANFATTVTNSIAGKVSKSGDTMTGNLTTTGLTVGNGVATGRQPYGPLANANIILTSSAADSSGVCGIEFLSGNNYPSDGASIYFQNNANGGSERAKLTIRVENDQEDFIELRAGKVVINANTYSGGGQNPAVVFQHNDSQIASITSGGQIDASGGNSSQWNTAYGWGDHSSVGYALNSSLANYLPLSGGVIGGAVTINGNLTVNGTITENSSIKLKENIETSEGNLEKVVNLRPVTYNKIGSQTTELGLIAEEVAEVYPEFVQYDENGEPVGVHYSRLTAALIGAVKELNEQLQELKRNK